MLNRLRSLSWLGDSQVTLFDVRRRRPKEPVVLNVYDLWHLNDYTLPVGLGIFHSGVQLYGTEYGYGGHSLLMTGIFETEPRNHNGDIHENFRYRQSIVLGHTHLSRQEVRRIIDKMGHEFSGYHYHVVTHNCNHFSSKLADVLCGGNIPGWINRVANMVAHVPFLVQCLTPPHQLRHQQRHQQRRQHRQYHKY